MSVTDLDVTIKVLSNLTLLATENNQLKMLSAGVYSDSVICVDGTWKILNRHLDLDKAY